QPLAADYTPPPQTTGSITGTVRSGGVGVANVRISFTGPANGNTNTDETGHYVVPQLPTGTYHVSATLPGATVVPAERVVAIDRQNAEKVDFEAGGIVPANAPSISFVTPAAVFTGTTAINIKVG